MVRELTVAIVGLGIGRSHLEAFGKVKAARVTAICDLSEERRAQCSAQYGVKGVYRDYEQMLRSEQPDIFVVALPNYLHHAATLAGLRAGAHILCEKPMAMNARQAEQMCEAAERAGRKIMIDFTYRFDPASQALKALIEQGELGDIYFARTVWHRRRGIPGAWFASKKHSGGGALVDLGVHRIDLALWFMGRPEPVSVSASTYAAFGPKIMGKKFDVEDLGVGFIKFANGASLAVEASWACEQPRQEQQQTELMGTRGGAVQFNIGDEYRYDFTIYKERDGSLIETRPTKNIGKYQTLQAHFADCIRRDTEPTASGRDGLYLSRILDAMYKSARTGKTTNLSR